MGPHLLVPDGRQILGKPGEFPGAPELLRRQQPSRQLRVLCLDLHTLGAASAEGFKSSSPMHSALEASKPHIHGVATSCAGK